MKTIKVRIAVAVAPNGSWSCCGWTGAKDDEILGIAIDGLDEDGEAHYFVEAELVVPERTTVHGTVETAQ